MNNAHALNAKTNTAKSAFVLNAIAASITVMTCMDVAHATTGVEYADKQSKIVTVGGVVIGESQIDNVGLGGAKLSGSYEFSSGIETASTRKWYMIPRDMLDQALTCNEQEGEPGTPCTKLGEDSGDHNTNALLALDAGPILGSDYIGQHAVFCVVPRGYNNLDESEPHEGVPVCTVSEHTLRPFNDKPTPPTAIVSQITSTPALPDTNSILTVTYTYSAPDSGSNIGEEEGATLLYWQNESGQAGTIEVDHNNGQEIVIDEDGIVHTATIDLSKYVGDELLKIEGHKLRACIQPVTVGGVSGEEYCSNLTANVAVPVTDEAPVLTNVQIRNNSSPVSEVHVGKTYHSSYKYSDLEFDHINATETNNTISWHVEDVGNLPGFNFTPTAAMLDKSVSVCVTPVPNTGNTDAVEVCSTGVTVVN